MNKRALAIPKFKNETGEADWWASPAGRDYVKGKSAEARSKGIRVARSRLVARLNRKSSV